MDINIESGYLLRSRYCQQIFYTSPRQWGLRDYSRICRKTFGDLVKILGKNIQIKDEPNLSVGTNTYTFLTKVSNFKIMGRVKITVSRLKVASSWYKVTYLRRREKQSSIYLVISTL